MRIPGAAGCWRADRDPDERGGQKPSASAAADKKAAEAVETRISGIGTVTKKSAQAIFDARAAYDALTPAQKRLVGNHAQLLAAETAYARAGGAMSFQDVERGYWAEDAICYLHGRGAMNGTSAVTFDPEGPITGDACRHPLPPGRTGYRSRRRLLGCARRKLLRPGGGLGRGKRRCHGIWRRNLPAG